MPTRRRRQTGDEQLEAIAIDAASQLLSARRGRQIAMAIVICALLFAIGFWIWQHELRPGHPVGPTVRIATWNLREFSENRHGIDLRAIANIITSSHFDIVAIQEVKRDGEEIDRLLNALGTRWRSTSFSNITGNHERFTFIYNGDHVQEVGTAHFIATAQAVIFDRTPYQQTFRAGNFDFTLIICHLFYGEDSAGYGRRRKECEVLSRFASDYAARSSEKDVIVLGDFNETRGHENLQTFSAIGWESLNLDPTNLGGTETYDTLLIDPKFTHEWNGVAGSIHFDEQMFNNDDRAALEKVSDHRPAYADFVTTLADDD